MPVTRVPVYCPSLEEMNSSFEAYIERHEAEIERIGACIIEAPAGWSPRCLGYGDSIGDIVVKRPIRQHCRGTKGVYRLTHVSSRRTKVQDLQEMENTSSSSDRTRSTLVGTAIDRAFWKNVTHAPPLYGADQPGSLFDTNLKEWNLGRLDSLLSRTLEGSKVKIPGVNTPYLYFGTWRSMFGWHTEDADLYSVNYLHFGMPKSWYVVPPSHKARFERLMIGLYPDLHKSCPEFLRHKETLVSPHVLQQCSIPVLHFQQGPRQFVINFPGAYHAGFNHGYNCAESINFATKRWLSFGLFSKPCGCNPDSVSIQFDMFLHLLTEENLRKWRIHSAKSKTYLHPKARAYSFR